MDRIQEPRRLSDAVWRYIAVAAVSIVLAMTGSYFTWWSKMLQSSITREEVIKINSTSIDTIKDRLVIIEKTNDKLSDQVEFLRREIERLSIAVASEKTRPIVYKQELIPGSMSSGALK
jgi:hypothetical protein